MMGWNCTPVASFCSCKVLWARDKPFTRQSWSKMRPSWLNWRLSNFQSALWWDILPSAQKDLLLIRVAAYRSDGVLKVDMRLVSFRRWRDTYVVKSECLIWNPCTELSIQLKSHSRNVIFQDSFICTCASHPVRPIYTSHEKHSTNEYIWRLVEEKAIVNTFPSKSRIRLLVFSATKNLYLWTAKGVYRRGHVLLLKVPYVYPEICCYVTVGRYRRVNLKYHLHHLLENVLRRMRRREHWHRMCER